MFRLRPYLCRKVLRVGKLAGEQDAPSVHTAGKAKRLITRDDVRAKRKRVAKWRRRKGYS